ncbi:hypothetical protein GCM10009682_06480 [Luedemannella flava]|uniref:Integral membrane protein n=1 Tax=Luedemannella flava TaxID=349316 RepID=A0ABN2LGA9_9ACTN
MATELRVHGVNGAPAEEVLDRPWVGRVAGDTEAGFYRPRPETHATTGPGGADLEAYRWGSLTSGAAARAAWLLLLPFTLANVTVWLRPPAGPGGRAVVRGLCRLFALSLTVTFVLTIVGAAMDLVAWQCASPGTGCMAGRPWLRGLFTGFFVPPGRRLALGALAPIGVIAVLWALGRGTWARYESFRPAGARPDGDGLASPTFWHGRVPVGRLRALHIAVALATVDAVLLWVLVRHDRAGGFAGVDLGPLSASAARAIGVLLGVLTMVVLVGCALVLLTRGMMSRDAPARWAGSAVRAARGTALALTAASLGYALLPRAPWRATGALPGYGRLVTWLFAAQLLVLAALAVVVAVQIGAARRYGRLRDPLLGGFGTPIVGSLGLGLGVAFSAGLTYRVADYLDRAASPSPADWARPVARVRLEPPLSFQWAALGFLVGVVVAVLAYTWVRTVTMPRLRAGARAATDEDFPGGRSRDPARAADIDDAIVGARATDHIGGTVGVAWGVLAVGVLAATGLALAGLGPVQLAPSGSAGADLLHALTTAGTYLINLTALALVLLGVQAYRHQRVRRVVGVIWDVATFWPRAAHPLGVPCYAERAVPELAHRAAWLAGRGGVVLSGHSQGAVLVAAAVLQLPADARPGTAMLTYGSPLRRLYGRAFPAYFHDGVFGELAEAVGGGEPRWRNLWRRTDAIGGPVAPGGLDVRLVDPLAFDPPPGDRVAPAIAGHFDYQLSPAFAAQVTALLDRLRRPDR